MFYIEQDNKILQFEETREQLEILISFAPQYDGFEIKESEVDIVDFEGGFYFVNDEEYLAKVAQKEAERIAKLYLTGADVERGIYQAKGMDFDDILAFVTANPPEGFDVKALKIELKANHFSRGNPYVNAVGALLGFTSKQLDNFFETNNYEALILLEEEENDNTTNEPTDVPVQPQDEDGLQEGEITD